MVFVSKFIFIYLKAAKVVALLKGMPFDALQAGVPPQRAPFQYPVSGPFPSNGFPYASTCNILGQQQFPVPSVGM